MTTRPRVIVIVAGVAGLLECADGEATSASASASSTVSAGESTATTATATTTATTASTSASESTSTASTITEPTSTADPTGTTTEVDTSTSAGESTEVATTEGPPLDFDDPNPLEDRPLAAGWTCEAFVYGADIWMRTLFNGQARFDLRIGAGGAIAELRDVPAGYAALLSPPFADEVTDRVIQWTLWSPSIMHMIAQLPAFEWRFNVTQAGTFNDTLAPIHRVELDPGACRVDVYASPRDQWKTEQQPHMSGAFAARTRYDVIGPGQIVIRRTVRIGETALDGQAAALGEVYHEAWTPLRQPTFDAMAVTLDAGGAPGWWYKAGQNLPAYPQIDVTTTEGYALTFRSDAPSATAVGVVFGLHHPCRYVGGECLAAGAYALNSLEWTTGIGVLPGLTLTDLGPGQLLDQYLVIAPSHGISAAFGDDLRAIAMAIPAARVLDAGAILAPELTALASELAAMVDEVGVRTDHLAPLLP